MKILLATYGSLGDLHPYIAVGKGLRERGHNVTIGAAELYRAKVEGEGLCFHPLRPDLTAIIDHPEIMRHVYHPRTGTEYVVRKLVLPNIEGAFEDSLAAMRGADLVVGHPLTCGVPLACELTKTPRISVALAPSNLISAYDPPTIPGLPLLDRCRRLGPGFWSPALRLIMLGARRWGEPINLLRRKLGLPTHENPLLADMFSPFGNQAWFSRVLAERQPDWPPNTTITGFPFYDRQQADQSMSLELRAFLDAGPAPVVFTLGSSAVFEAGAFYSESAKAAKQAGIRAVLLTGRDPRNHPAEPLGDSIFVAEYAPYSELLPLAAATVHQGGIGTTAQALRSGNPMIVVPYSHDQPDNARRVAGLGVARVIRRHNYRAQVLVDELVPLLAEASYQNSALEVAGQMASEDGVVIACEGIERFAA